MNRYTKCQRQTSVVHQSLHWQAKCLNTCWGGSVKCQLSHRDAWLDRSLSYMITQSSDWTLKTAAIESHCPEQMSPLFIVQSLVHLYWSWKYSRPWGVVHSHVTVYLFFSCCLCADVNVWNRSWNILDLFVLMCYNFNWSASGFDFFRRKTGSF